MLLALGNPPTLLVHVRSTSHLTASINERCKLGTGLSSHSRPQSCFEWLTQSQVMLKVCPGASTKIWHFTESEYAHFTFWKIIWPLSLLSNLRTDIMTSAETVLRLYCRDCVLRLYLGQRLSVHVMYLICTYVLPQPCLCFARLPWASIFL